MKADFGPSISHVAGALGVQWGLFLFTALVAPALLDTYVLAATGMFAAGVWLGREFEQLWPHVGYKPRPPIDSDDVSRFARQGLWPLASCTASLVLFAVWS